jgi:Histidine kinase-, DNA gyrase B-, and HSP90-like ATPase
MTIQLVIGPEAITSYQRLSYTAWHAIAEFIDNSTQSYIDNKDVLDAQLKKEGQPFEVSIVYEPNDGNGMLRVSDNAMGMSYSELERALHIALPPLNRKGRSRYGMGMKTASFWIGKKWSIKTKKLGETDAHEVIVDVDQIKSANTNNMALTYHKIPNQDPEKHYTLVEVSEHYRKFQGRTLGKIADFLRSMYRKDLESKQMRLLWRGVELTWEDWDSRLMQAADGSLYKKDILFDVDGKVVMGWVGILKKGEGGRVEAGFSVIQAKRVIHGWPEAWRPASIFGPYATNDTINQRLVGELELDGFEVSHTKDSIQWRGEEEEEVEKKLKEFVGDYRNIAQKKHGPDQRGPAEADINIAVTEFEKELSSSEMVDQINLNVNVVPPQQALIASRQKVISSIEQTRTPTLQHVIQTTPPVTIKIFLGTDLSERDAYVYQEATRPTEIIVTVNQNHPFWATQLRGADSVLEYLRQCTYDALAEWQAGTKASRFDADTIKWLKDGFLRLPMDIERHQADRDAAANDAPAMQADSAKPQGLNG